MNEWIELFTKIITGEKSRYFWVGLIVVAIMAIIIFPYVDANILYYDRIEKRIDNLSKLVELTGIPLEENTELNAEYESILSEMENAREKALSNTGKQEDSRHDRLIKFLSGGALWFLIAVIMPFNKKKGQKYSFKLFFNNLLAAFFCFAIGSVIGCVFVYVPTLGVVELNAVLAPVAQLVILLLVTQKPKKKST